MERVRQIASFWNWLPAFRVVAETEHLPTAAQQLGVTAPALSRSIRLLEQQLGQPLFRKVGRNIVLTDVGRHFLDSLRDGMRLIHEGTEQLRDAQLHGDVVIQTSGLITTFLVQALGDLRREHPGLRPVIRNEPPSSVAERLFRGEVDLALHDRALSVPRLTSEYLGEASSGIYCGPGHPLFDVDAVELADLEAHEFVAPAIGPSEADATWPVELRRKVAARVSHMHVGCEICAQGALLATLPDVVAEEYGGGVLKRLPLDIIPKTKLFATLRPSLGIPSRADAVLAVVRRRIA